MGNWFCDKKSVENRGLIFGLWTCHQYMGDITAALCTAVVLGKIVLLHLDIRNRFRFFS